MIKSIKVQTRGWSKVNQVEIRIWGMINLIGIRVFGTICATTMIIAYITFVRLCFDGSHKVLNYVIGWSTCTHSWANFEKPFDSPKQSIKLCGW